MKKKSTSKKKSSLRQPVRTAKKKAGESAAKKKASTKPKPKQSSKKRSSKKKAVAPAARKSTKRKTTSARNTVTASVDESQPQSLPRLREILSDYYTPVIDYEAIGDRVPFNTLTRRINREWNLTGNRRFINGEIDAETVVIDLATEIDYRSQA